MKNKIFGFIVCLCLLFSSIFGQSPSIDIKTYNIKANCDFSNRKIDISANVEIGLTKNVNSIKILLGSWIKINSISTLNTELKYSRKTPEDDTLLISIPTQFNANKKNNLLFNYTLFLDSLDTSNKNVIFLQRATLWYPLLFDNIAGMKLNIIAPDNYTVFSVGNLVSKTKVNHNFEYNFETGQNNRYAVFAVKTDTFNTTITKKTENLNINFFFVSKDSATNNQIIKEVCNSWSFYNKYIGAYKYNQLNIVEIPYNKMMYVQSLSSLILIGSPFINAYKLDNNWPVHEVAHQWWGCGIFTNNRAKGGLFLEESVNEYFKILYTENTLNNDSLKNLFKSYLELYNSIDKSKELSILDINDLSTMDKGFVIYQKGPLVINKIKNLMGSESYKKFIKECYNTYCNKLFTYDDFIKILSKYDSDKKLVIMLSKWLSEKGYN